METLESSLTIISVAASRSSVLYATLTSASAKASHVTDVGDLVSLSQAVRGAKASLSIIEAEKVLSTATASSAMLEALMAIYDASVDLKLLLWEQNAYDIWELSRPANIIFLVVFAFTVAYMLAMLWKSRYHWFNVTFVAGYILEFLGFLGRVLSFSDMTNMDFYIMQLVCLTIAPAFIMGGIYFLFAQLVVVHGRPYSLLKPLWYSYIFITCDIISLVIQAGGGGSASIASQNGEDASPGTNTMIAGIAFQVFSMTFFLYFWFDFLIRIYFNVRRGSKNKGTSEPSSKEKNASDSASSLGGNKVSQFLGFLFSLNKAYNYVRTNLEPHYNPHFADVREHKLFRYYPLAITAAVAFIYIRCVYRVVELAEGFGGFLITHEVYVMVFDALMIALAGLIFLPFHPVWVLGSVNKVKLATIRKNKDVMHMIGSASSESENEESEG